jgi:SAM-dependent methyltransferase
MSGDYGYRGLMAENWDLLRGDTSGWTDTAWYRAVVEQGAGPALDVGCGTGRTLLDLLARGFDVDGLDNSPEMLALCRAKGEAAGYDMASRLHRGEMQALDLPRRYATIFVPSTSIQLLTDPADLDRAFGAFHGHLARGGRIAVSFRTVPWNASEWPEGKEPADGEWSDWLRDAKAEREDGAIVRRWFRGRWRPQMQRSDGEYRYEVTKDGAVIAAEVLGEAFRVCSLDEAVARATAAGFADVHAYRENSFDPAMPADERFKLIGTRSA